VFCFHRPGLTNIYQTTPYTSGIYNTLSFSFKNIIQCVSLAITDESHPPSASNSLIYIRIYLTLPLPISKSISVLVTPSVTGPFTCLSRLPFIPLYCLWTHFLSLLFIINQTHIMHQKGYWHQRADERHDNPPQGNQELLVVRDKVGRPQVSLG